MIKKETFITGFIVCVPIIIIVYVMSLFSLSQTWPAFFVVLFYALGGYQLKNLKSIFEDGYLFDIKTSTTSELTRHTACFFWLTILFVYNLIY